jgi:hypothetical protein
MTMAIPWLVALRAVPWGTIIANAPSILRSADALRSRAEARCETVSSNDVQALGERVAGLEQRDRESIEVITQLTGQVAALTAAVEVLEARAQWLLVIATGAIALAVLAGGLSLLARG